jgi:beta-galactosidase
LIVEIDGNPVQTRWWYEILQPEGDTSVLSKWKSRHQSGQAAMTLHHAGKGAVIYVGTYLTTEIMQALAPTLERLSGIQTVLPGLPEGVSAVIRESAERKLYFLVNYSDQPVSIQTAPNGMDLVTGTPVKGVLELAPYGVAVIEN